MKKVYLTYAAQSEINRDSKASNIALWRRMTALQKAVLSVYMQASESEPKLFLSLKESRAPIYFASAYGEAAAMYRITESIEDNSLPVSPKDFQHSVLNASIAYVSMQGAGHASGLAISGGFASADKALHLAARRISAGLDESIILLHGHEWVGPIESARAELLVLSAKAAEAKFELEAFEESKGGIEIDPDHDELRDAGQIPWILSENRPDLIRQVRNLYNSVFLSRWRELV